MAKKYPRGLSYDEDRRHFRIQFVSRHTQPGRLYRERLPSNATRKKAELYLAKLQEDDRLGSLSWPSEVQKIEHPKFLTVGEFVEQVYMPHAAAHNKPATVSFKTKRLKSLASVFWDLSLEMVSVESVVQYQAKKKLEGKSSRTINADISTLSHLLLLAHEMGYLAHPPAKFRRLRETDRKERKPLSPEEAQEAIDSAFQKSQLWGTVALFLLHTGGRWTETRELLWESIDLERKIVLFKAKNAKQGRDREVPLHNDLVEALLTLPRLGNWVFMRRYRKEILQLSSDPRNSSQGCAWGEFGPHIFRHTFAHWKLRSGVPIAVVSRWLGHASIQITADMYGHIDGGQHHEEMLRGPSVEVRRLRIIGDED